MPGYISVPVGFAVLTIVLPYLAEETENGAIGAE
jgi:hypothetical protein